MPRVQSNRHPQRRNCSKPGTYLPLTLSNNTLRAPQRLTPHCSLQAKRVTFVSALESLHHQSLLLKTALLNIYKCVGAFRKLTGRPPSFRREVPLVGLGPASNHIHHFPVFLPHGLDQDLVHLILY